MQITLYFKKLWNCSINDTLHKHRHLRLRTGKVIPSFKRPIWPETRNCSDHTHLTFSSSLTFNILLLLLLMPDLFHFPSFSNPSAKKAPVNGFQLNASLCTHAARSTSPAHLSPANVRGQAPCTCPYAGEGF